MHGLRLANRPDRAARSRCIDANAEAAAGQALDLLHGSALMADQVIRSGGYEQIPDSDLICITAGLRRKPDESRLDLINRNVELFTSILGEIQQARHKPDAIVLVVSNPVDVLTYLAAKKLDLPPSRVIGLGTQLDTIRFRSLDRRAAGRPADAGLGPDPRRAWRQHGADLVERDDRRPAARKVSGLVEPCRQRTLHAHQGSGAEVIKKKGGAGFAVGLAIQEVIESIALDRRRVLPVSSVQSGCYGLRDVAISVPTVVGRAGVLGTREIELWPKELQALRQSGKCWGTLKRC